MLHETIQALELGSIRHRLGNKYRWPADRIAQAEQEYRHFLMAAAADPTNEDVPPGDVDAFWHEHILDTRKYAADCQSIFGGFLHHVPSDDGTTCDKMNPHQESLTCIKHVAAAATTTCTKSCQGPTKTCNRSLAL